MHESAFFFSPPPAPRRACNSLLQQTRRLQTAPPSLSTRTGAGEREKDACTRTHTHTPVWHVGTVPRSLNPSPALRQAAQDATLSTHTFERHGYTIGKSQMTVTTSQQTGITTVSERLPPGCGLPLSAVTVTDGVAAVAAGQVR